MDDLAGVEQPTNSRRLENPSSQLNSNTKKVRSPNQTPTNMSTQQIPQVEALPRNATAPVLHSDGRYRKVDLSAIMLLRPSRRLRWVTRVTIGLLIASILAMIFVPWQQTSRGYGQVIAMNPLERPQPVMATAKGIISKVRDGLREGTFVKKGEVVLYIEPFAQDAQRQMEWQLAQIQAKIDSAENKKMLAEQAVELQKIAGNAIIESARSTVESAQAKVAQARDKVQGLAASVERTKADFDRSTNLFPEGLKSQKELIKDKENYLKAVADFEAAEAAVVEATKDQMAKEQDLLSKSQEVEVKNREAEAKLQDALASMAIARKEFSETQQKLSEYGGRLEIESPHDGYLHEIFGLSGSAVVKEGDILFTVVPIAEDLAVEMIVRGNDIPLLHINDEVRLQFEGYPAVQFIGWPSAAQGTFGGRVALINPTDDGQGNFRIVVTPDKEQEPWPDNRYLRQGVLANGWVLLSTHEGKLCQVPLGYEIWRQLNGFPPVVAEKPPEPGKDSKSKNEKAKIKLPK
jgi:multidrug resistance efflux pump